MKKYFLLLSCFLVVLTSCFEDRDDKIEEPDQESLHNFVYNGMNQYYLYREEVNIFEDSHFDDQEDLNTFLEAFSSPEELFESIVVPEDRFSFIVPDFHVLENQLQGNSLHNGMEFGLVEMSSTGAIFGYVRYVLPNSSAEDQGVERGMIFNKIDGTTIDESNFNDLLDADSYSIGLAEIEEDELVSLDESIHLTKTDYTENPVYLAKTIEVENHTIGYLMYNAFTSSFDGELNQAFADFEADGVTDLVVDLRYNGGGNIRTSLDLAGMITGQFQGDLFATEAYNQHFEDKELNFSNKTGSGQGLNSLNLDKVYIIATESTASASELLINGLNPYIDVVQIGGQTVGKFQGSTTVYDSHNYSRSAVKPGHNYAMQPLILKTINADGNTDYIDGLMPDIEQQEDFANLGELGNPDELLLQTAIQQIAPTTQPASQTTSANMLDYEHIGETKMNLKTYQKMYTENKKE